MKVTKDGKDRKHEENVKVRNILLSRIIKTNNQGVNIREIERDLSIMEKSNRKIHIIKSLARQYGISIHILGGLLYLDEETSSEYNISCPPKESIVHSGVKFKLNDDNKVSIRNDLKNDRMMLYNICTNDTSTNDTSTNSTNNTSTSLIPSDSLPIPVSTSILQQSAPQSPCMFDLLFQASNGNISGNYSEVSPLSPLSSLLSPPILSPSLSLLSPFDLNVGLNDSNNTSLIPSDSLPTPVSTSTLQQSAPQSPSMFDLLFQASNGNISGNYSGNGSELSLLSPLSSPPILPPSLSLLSPFDLNVGLNDSNNTMSKLMMQSNMMGLLSMMGLVQPTSSMSIKELLTLSSIINMELLTRSMVGIMN